VANKIYHKFDLVSKKKLARVHFLFIFCI